MIADEVFADYEFASGAASDAGQVFARRDVLVFGLGGLSKSIGLPQVKLGWIAVAGPDDTVAEALGRLEFASDAYLSVSTPVQLAAAGLLEHGGVVRRQIQARVSGNYDRLVARGARTPACRVLRADAGWYAIVQVPTLCSEEQLVLELLEREGVLAHPGCFYDFPGGSHLVISLLGRAGPFAEGIERLFGRFDSPGSGRTA
jgi:aspartate/methionine/tyrosine aminotransferase